MSKAGSTVTGGGGGLGFLLYRVWVALVHPLMDLPSTEEARGRQSI